LTLGQLDLVIFDFDGTLAELTIDFDEMRRRVERLAVEHGLDLEAAGQPYILEAVTELASRGGRAGNLFAQQAEAAIVEIELDGARKGRLFPGVRRNLAQLADQGLKVAVITRNCRQAVETVFPDIAACCHLFVPREDEPKPKPAVEHILKVCKTLGIRAERSLVVGDHPLDVVSGRAVGAFVCGLTTGRKSAADLAGADLVLDSLDELVEAVVNTG